MSLIPRRVVPGFVVRAARILVLFTLCGCASMGAPGTSSSSSAGAAGPFDVVIVNGRVVDGTGNPWYYADVAIRGDRIAAVAPPHAFDGASAARRGASTRGVL